MKTLKFEVPSDGLFPVEFCVFVSADTCVYERAGGDWLRPLGYEARLRAKVKSMMGFDLTVTREQAIAHFEAETTSFNVIQIRYCGQYLATELRKKYLAAASGDVIKAAVALAKAEGFPV